MTASDAGSGAGGRSPEGPAAGDPASAAANMDSSGSVAEDADELRMQRLIDLLNHRRHHRLEVRGTRDLLRNTPKQPLGIVSLTEEVPVHAPQPGLAVGADDEQRQPDHGKQPPARLEHDQQGLIAVHDDVDQQQCAERRDQGVDKAAGQRVTQALAYDEADVEEPVTQDRVGERRRERRGTPATSP